VDTYPCPACGGVADETTGCRTCGRPHDPEAAALARLNQRLAGLDRESRDHAGDQSALRAERARIQAEADALRASLVRRLTLEAGSRTPTQVTEGLLPIQKALRRGSSLTTDEVGPPDEVVARPPRQRQPAEPIEPPDQDSPETSPRSAQNTLLTLGGVLLGIAAIVVTGFFYTSAATGGRAFVLGLATLLALSIPLLLTRRTLTATAETIAAFGLLAVLLDGYAAYFARLAGLGSVPLKLFSAVLFGLVAAIAAAYRLASHLRAPQFAALLAVQPFLPLIAAARGFDLDGFGAVFAVVAALNLASVELLSRDIGRAIARVRLPGAAPGPGGQAWPRRLRELAWILFGATLGVGFALSIVGLAQATTVAAAVRSALVLLLAAAVGVGGGLMSRRTQLVQAAGGVAALAIIAAVSRVNALALPEYTLVLTAAVAAAIALVSGLLPEASRRGPRVGSLLGAALTAAVVLASVAKTMVETVRAATSPGVWAADVGSFVERVHVADWQYPPPRVLLAILAVAAAPPVAGGRADRRCHGGHVGRAAPGARRWAVPIVARAVSTVALPRRVAGTAQSALVRTGGRVTRRLRARDQPGSRSSPRWSALVDPGFGGHRHDCRRLVDRWGPYADRVGGAPQVRPVTLQSRWAPAPGSRRTGAQCWYRSLLATAIGVLAATLAQVAASPRTASGWGAGASAGLCCSRCGKRR
jgi:hypothetical protein